jgi:predicted nucleic acid-binding protein
MELARIISMFEELAEIRIHVPEGLHAESVHVRGELNSVPWDCVLAELARQLGYHVVTSPEGVALAPGIGPGDAPRH